MKQLLIYPLSASNWLAGLLIAEAVLAIVALVLFIVGVGKDIIKPLYVGVALFFGLDVLMCLNPIVGVPDSKSDSLIGLFLFGAAVIMCLVVSKGNGRQDVDHDKHMAEEGIEEIVDDGREPQLNYADLINVEDRSEVADNLSELMIADERIARTLFCSVAFYIAKTKGVEAAKVLGDAIHEFAEAEWMAKEMFKPLENE